MAIAVKTLMDKGNPGSYLSVRVRCFARHRSSALSSPHKLYFMTGEKWQARCDSLD
jgi:hypothetical protein